MPSSGDSSPSPSQSPTEPPNSGSSNPSAPESSGSTSTSPTSIRVLHLGFLELAGSSLCTTRSPRPSFDNHGTERPKFPAPRLGKRTGRIKHVFRPAVVFQVRPLSSSFGLASGSLFFRSCLTQLGDCPFTIIRIARCNLDDGSLK
ncbi:hypothetical protein JCM5296_003584 [Sporobolomyces johnsonii]